MKEHAGFSIGEIVGHRCWVRHEGLLYSPHSEQPWPNDEATIISTWKWWGTNLKLNGFAGIYAYKTFDDLSAAVLTKVKLDYLRRRGHAGDRNGIHVGGSNRARDRLAGAARIGQIDRPAGAYAQPDLMEMMKMDIDPEFDPDVGVPIRRHEVVPIRRSVPNPDAPVTPPQKVPERVP
jgi:hypothetical protein